MKNCFIISLYATLICCKSNSNTQILTHSINDKIIFLSNDYKYNILVNYDVLPPVNRLKGLLDKSNIFDNNALVNINYIFEKYDLNNSNFNFKVNDKSTYLLYVNFAIDKIIQKLIYYKGDFKNLKSKVYVTYQDKDTIQYNIVLIASDTLFKPEIFVIRGGQKIPIYVENGIGKFNIHSYRSDTLEGEIRLPLEKTYPFYYPESK
jgi:hypothetical protein